MPLHKRKLYAMPKTCLVVDRVSLAFVCVCAPIPEEEQQFFLSRGKIKKTRKRAAGAVMM